MGDMKTPDFDDLLAAFDIPDIDAIQSSPEEEEEEEEEGGEEKEERRRGGAAHERRRSPQSFPEAPAVSVIVKNTVRCEEEEEEDAREDASADRPSHSQVQDKLGDAASEADAKHSSATMEPPVSNGFERATASEQGPKKAVPWPHHPLLLGDDEDGKAAEDGEVQNPASAINHLAPHLYPAAPKFPAPSSPHSGNLSSTPPPLHSPQKEEPCLLDNPPSPPSPLPQNGGRSAARSDDDDSELDLGSPLVIQESPEFMMPSPHKGKHRQKPPSPEADFLSHHLHAPSSVTSEKQEAEPPTLSPSSPTPSPRDQPPPLTADPTSVQEERCPEHVIDERDSPESPPPSEMGLVFTQRHSTPDLTPALLSHHQEGLTDSKPSGEDKTGNTEEKKVAGKDITEQAVGAGPPKMAMLQQRPLKVKIKMPKGSFAKAETGAAPKRGGKASASKSSTAESHGTRSKREQPETVSFLQEALEGSGAVKDKMAKSKVSATAVSITKTASLPSISAASASRGGAGGINLRSLGQKTLSSGAAQTVLLPAHGSGNRPASIVNSTGAIISKSQTNLVESFNKILNNKNLLPSYKPDLSSPLPAEWGLPLPAQGYRCLECGDAFALEQSLARHYDRRSLRIEVTCNHCAKRLAFFNKCSLLLHAREHKEKGLIMQCSHLVMKPVPVEQMIGQQEPTANGQTAPSPSPRQAAPGKKSDGMQYVGNKCPECQTQFSSKEDVAQHFQEIRAAHTTSCTECSPPMLLPNSCSAAAHQRIHQSAAPHVCPECGGTAKQSAFQTHLDETCLHFARRIGYRCSSCLVVFGGLNSVKAHIQQAHCDMFHKCPSCPMAFKSAPSTQNHIAAQHPTLTDGQAMLIYKCVMCDTVFTQKPLLYVHFDTHLTNQKVHVFKCPECTKLFSQRNSLMDHYKSHKTLLVKQELPSPPAAPTSSSSRPSALLDSSEGDEWMETDKEEKVKTERVKTPSGWKCVPCHARYTDREEFIAHMAKQHDKILKKFPCNKCESSFTTTSSMRRHIRDKHKVMNRGFRCQFCVEGKKTFSSRAMLEKHIQLRHGMDAAGQDKLTGGRDEADSSSEQDGAPGARRRRRGGVKVEPEEEEPADGAGPAKKQRASSAYSKPESGFRCAPCGFTTEEQAAFLEHITQHQRAGSEVQCQQCGACFTSNNSLSRHLFITHKVRDAFADSQQSAAGRPGPSAANSRNHDDRGAPGGSAPASPSAQGVAAVAAQGNEDEDTLACKVCGKHFDKVTDLNTHFRTHGMAFINARNAGKTT